MSKMAEMDMLFLLSNQRIFVSETKSIHSRFHCVKQITKKEKFGLDIVDQIIYECGRKELKEGKYDSFIASYHEFFYHKDRLGFKFCRDCKRELKKQYSYEYRSKLDYVFDNPQDCKYIYSFLGEEKAERLEKTIGFINNLQSKKYNKYQIKTLKRVVYDIIHDKIPDVRIKEFSSTFLYRDDVDNKHDLIKVFSGHWENLFATAYNMIHENQF